MGMTMTTISNNLNAGNALKTEASGNHQSTSADNAFSSILAMQAPATPGSTENSRAANNATRKESVTQSNQASGKAENGSAASNTENNTSPSNEAAQADSLPASENTAADAYPPAPTGNALNAGHPQNETLQAGLLAEQAILQQLRPDAGIQADQQGKPVLENTILSQLIEPQRNLASRLSGKNLADIDARAASDKMVQLLKDAQAASANAKPDALSGTHDGQLDMQAAAGRTVNLNAREETAGQIRDMLLGRLSADTRLADPADPRNLNFKLAAQPLANQAIDTLPEATVAANANTNTAVSASVTNTQAQAPASPLISIGTSFYHPGWSQAMAQQLATQASLFFRQQANGTHIAQMRLDPPELGPIKVSISIQDGVAQAAFVASNATVRQALENSLADLHQALQEKGLSLGQAHVGQQDRQDSFFMEDNKTLGTAGQTEGSAGILADAGNPATAQPRQHDGLIKTFA